MVGSRLPPMQALQAAGLIFLLVGGLFLGITEPWAEEADPDQVQSSQDVYKRIADLFPWVSYAFPQPDQRFFAPITCHPHQV